MATIAANTTQNMPPAVAGAPGAVAQPGQAQVPATQGAVNNGVGLPNVSEIMQQPAVRKAMPAIIAFLSVAVFLIAYSWMQDPVYRAPWGTKKAVCAVSYSNKHRVIQMINVAPLRNSGGDQMPTSDKAIGTAAQNNQSRRRPMRERVRSDKNPIMGSVMPSHKRPMARIVPMMAGAISKTSVANFMKYTPNNVPIMPKAIRGTA